MSNLPRILIVEDNNALQESLADYFSDIFPNQAKLVHCYTLAEGEAAFAKDPNSFAACIVDGHIPNENSPGLRLVKTIAAQNPNVKIIAFSGNADICRDMVDAGATYSVQGDKGKVFKMLREVLSAITSDRTLCPAAD